MLVKDSKGNYYEIEENVLNKTKVDPNKAREQLVAERAAKHKKVTDFLSSLDEDEIAILHDKVISTLPERTGGALSANIVSKVPTGNVHINCRGWNWGTSGGHAACDCTGGHPACDCGSKRTGGITVQTAHPTVKASDCNGGTDCQNKVVSKKTASKQ